MREPNKKKFWKIMWCEMERVRDDIEANHPKIKGTSSRKKFANASGLNYSDIYYYSLGRQISPIAAFRAFKNLKKKGIFIDTTKLCGYEHALINVSVDG